MAKLLFMGVRGSADPTNAMPFIMANGAVQSGHETQIVLANEAVDLMSGVIAENLMPFGWPPFKEILAETLLRPLRPRVARVDCTSRVMFPSCSTTTNTICQRSGTAPTDRPLAGSSCRHISAITKIPEGLIPARQKAISWRSDP